MTQPTGSTQQPEAVEALIEGILTREAQRGFSDLGLNICAAFLAHAANLGSLDDARAYIREHDFTVPEIRNFWVREAEQLCEAYQEALGHLNDNDTAEAESYRH